jgi:hypothetical protein
MPSELRIQGKKLADILKASRLPAQRDAEQLTIYGLAYLTDLHEGQAVHRLLEHRW